MSLPRKEVKPYFDHDVHAAILAIAEAEGYGDGVAKWVEAVVVGVVTKRVHAANLVVKRLNESGALGTFTDDPGYARTGAE